METPPGPQCVPGRGLWSHARAPPMTKESQERLEVMKQESRLVNLQKKHVQQNSKPPLPPPAPVTRPSYISQRRSAESCMAGNSYERERFRPGPSRDLEKEKMRLQNIFATGRERKAKDATPARAPVSSPQKERDRYEEVLEEIEERKQFLADMAALGQEREYIDLINAEINQKKRELDVLRKTRRLEDRGEDDH